MPVARSSRYDIDDATHFDANLRAFVEWLGADDPGFGEVLKRELSKRLGSEIERSALWDALCAASDELR
jgi:hypothetical protein